MVKESKSLTPERELLRLIEDPGVQSENSALKAKRNFFFLFSLSSLKARISFFKTKYKGNFNFQRFNSIEFRYINGFLELCIFVLFCGLVWNIIVSYIELNSEAGIGLDIKSDNPVSAVAEASLLKNPSYYLEKARTRDIFKMGLSNKIAEVEQIKDISVSKAAEAKQILKLVGISWSEDPDVIIEDTQSQKTYFLKRGQVINDFNVKAIFKDKVVLSYQDEELELR